MIVFCAFAFDPEAAKDIDATQGHHRAQGADEHRPADRRPEEGALQQPELLADGPAGRGGAARARTAATRSRCTASTTSTRPRASWCPAARARSPCGRSIPTTTSARLFPRQVFFPMAGKGEGWEKLKKDIRAELDEDAAGEVPRHRVAALRGGRQPEDRGEDRGRPRDRVARRSFRCTEAAR